MNEKNQIVNIIQEKVKDFKGLPNYEIDKDDRDERIKRAHLIEEFVAKKIEEITGYKCELDTRQDDRLNRLYGDFLIRHNYYDDYSDIRVELKVAIPNKPKNLLGTINLNTLDTFGHQSNYYYLLINNDGTKYLFINSKKLYNNRGKLNYEDKYITTYEIEKLYKKTDLK